jgi:hypothetical protein
LPDLEEPPAQTALVPVVSRQLASIRPAEAAKGAAALVVSLGLAAMRYEPTRQVIMSGLTALIESRTRKPALAPQPTVVQVVEVHQTVIHQTIINQTVVQQLPALPRRRE